MGSLSPMHWLIVIGVLVLLFGAKRLPDLARSVGQSARVLKGEMKDLNDDASHGNDTMRGAPGQMPPRSPVSATNAEDTVQHAEPHPRESPTTGSTASTNVPGSPTAR